MFKGFREECPKPFRAFILWSIRFRLLHLLAGIMADFGDMFVVFRISDWLGHFLEKSFLSLIHLLSQQSLSVYSVLGTALGTVDSVNNDMEMKLSSMRYIRQAFFLGTY